MNDQDTALVLQALIFKAINEWFDTGDVQSGTYPVAFHPALISQNQIGWQHQSFMWDIGQQNGRPDYFPRSNPSLDRCNGGNQSAIDDSIVGTT